MMNDMRGALTLTLVLSLLAIPAAALAAVDGRLEGTFRMAGRVTVARDLKGVRPGQRFTRTWRVHSTCATGPCDTVSLRRARHDGTDRLTLRRRSAGVYSGTGSFTVALRCGRRRYARGGLVPFTITLRILDAATVQTTPFATSVSASYVNRRRINRTPCPGGIGHESATYSGFRTGALPSPPVADFSASTPISQTVSFSDTSRDAAPIRARLWNFGDPASGDANSSVLASPRHTFTAPGIFTVTLAVRDANGLTASVQKTVSAG